MKTKIGILTIHRALNYGAIWQCWALKTICERNGYDVQVIDFNPFGNYKISDLIFHRFDKAYRYIYNYFSFTHFLKKYLNLTSSRKDILDIKTNPFEFDIYIVGSDTVWCAPLVKSGLEAYLLSWVPKKTKKIAYACSHGGVKAEGDVIQILKNELPTFDNISLREPIYLNEYSQLSGKTVVDVCDPTLLLTKEDYISMEIHKNIPQHYILSFDLAGDKSIEEMAIFYKIHYNLPVVNISTRAKWADMNVYNVNPQQWLYLMHHAEFIITNSFHGTAFSIIFEKQFICVQANVGGRAKTNARVINLLSQCGLQTRYVHNVEEVRLNNIDYNQCRENIKKYRQRSMQWLQNALNDATN